MTSDGHPRPPVAPGVRTSEGPLDLTSDPPNADASFVMALTPEIEALLDRVDDTSVRDALRRQLGVALSALKEGETEAPASQAEYLVTYSGKVPAGEVIL